jgi:hypothetical protein
MPRIQSRSALHPLKPRAWPQHAHARLPCLCLGIAREGGGTCHWRRRPDGDLALLPGICGGAAGEEGQAGFGAAAGKKVGRGFGATAGEEG